MNRILEHIVDKIRIRLYEIVQNLKDFEILLLTLKECTECHVITVELNGRNRLEKFLAICYYSLVSFLDLLFLLLQALKLLVYLLLHHSVQVLLLYLQLFNDPSE